MGKWGERVANRILEQVMVYSGASLFSQRGPSRVVVYSLRLIVGQSSVLEEELNQSLVNISFSLIITGRMVRLIIYETKNGNLLGLGLTVS